MEYTYLIFLILILPQMLSVGIFSIAIKLLGFDANILKLYILTHQS